MNGAFAADASVAFAWVYPVQASDFTDELLDRVEAGAEVVVPALWPLEVANVLLIAVRRRRMTAADRHTALQYLQALNVILDMEAPSLAFGKVSELAAERGLTIYDASYLELAMRRSLPLATQDQSLRRAAARAGISVL